MLQAESKKNSADLERGKLSGEYTAKLNAFNDISRKFTVSECIASCAATGL
jgi:hypothetical protein